MSDMRFIAAMERQADAEIEQKIQRAVAAERQRCIEENCEYCRGEGSYPMQRTPYRGYRGKFYHVLIGNKDDYGPSEILCRATLTHERIYQEGLKDGTD